MKKINHLSYELTRFDVADIDCFIAGWNAHRAGTPRETEEGYDTCRLGWDARDKRVFFKLSEFYAESK